MVTSSSPLSTPFNRFNGFFGMPKKPLNLLKGVLSGEEDVTIEYNDANAKFTFENFVLICRLIDGKYPNYEAVIPKENPNKLTVDRASFQNSVRRDELNFEKKLYLQLIC